MNSNENFFLLGDAAKVLGTSAGALRRVARRAKLDTRALYPLSEWAAVALKARLIHH
ncbi:DNA binding domain protein [Microbacterium phage IndyLu]|uniref:DNA binding domain protein n=1 Tax=Microbacterium phage IndyLu TaxID=2885152 RepID=UPI001E7412CD|nr:DNA binding domain protein [Microbacterium phage IndyLu]UDG78749.1 DNA binding domain protein [Microbacterium phage IndyLu]